MTNEEVKNNFVQNLAENAYINMCSVEEMNIAIKALEKQIPKKPVTSIHSRTKYIAYVCPVCKKRIISNIGGDWIAGHFQNHCDECGQALNWEGLKENEYRNS